MSGSPDNLALCLDGPLNGTYASLTNPPKEYESYLWSTGEAVLIHTSSKHTLLMGVEQDDGS